MPKQNRYCAALIALALMSASCSGDDASTSGTSIEPGSTSAPITAIDGQTTTTDTTPGQSVGTPEDPPPGNDLTGNFAKLSEPGVGGRITSVAFDPEDPERLLVGGDMLGIAVTDEFGESWGSTTGLASWEIGDITMTTSADGRVWTGSLSGPQASVDRGITWTLARNGMPDLNENRYSNPIEAVLIDPNDSAHLLAFNGNQRNWDAPGAYFGGGWQGDGSVWESVDSGQVWSRLATVAPGGNNRAATYLGGDSQLLLAAVANRGVWSTTDGGATWLESASGLPHFNAYDITGHPTDPKIAWVAMGEGPSVDGRHVPGGIWSTTDGGATWSAANEGLEIIGNSTPGNTGSFHQIVSAPTEPARLYTSNVAPGQAAIYRSDDSGASWRIIADGSTIRPDAYEGALRAFDIAVHPVEADRIAIGSDDTLLGSIDGGVNWNDLTTLEAVKEGFFAGRGYSGLVSTDIVFDPRLPDETILLGFDGGNFIQSIDDGSTWRRSVQDVSAWGGGVEAVYSPNDPARIYVLLGQFSNFRGIGISSDGGAGFELAAGPDRGLPPVGNVDGGARGIAVAKDGGADVVLVAVGELLYRSGDGGSLFAPVAGLDGIRDVVVAGDGQTMYAATATSIFTSNDLGLTFTPMDGAPSGTTALFSSASEPTALYVAAFRDGPGGVNRFENGVWTHIFTDRFAHGLAVDPTDPANIAVVTSEPAFHDVSNAQGVHLSNDGGATWVIMNAGLPMTRLRTAEFDPHEADRLVVGTTGRGFYEVSFSQALGNR